MRLSSLGWAIALVASGAGVAAYVVSERSGAAQRAEIARLEAQLAQRSDATPASAPPVFVAEAPARLDARDLDAIAERVAKLGAARAAAAAPSSEPRVPTPAEAEARREADRTLDGAIARGVLRRADVAALRASLRAAGDPEAGAALRRRIALALNEGRLRPEDRHDIFP